MNGDRAPSIDAWTEYWKSGRGASCFEGSDVEVRLNRLWEQLVDELSEGARVLDLATGNGTVAACCAARGRARGIGLTIEGVDAAAIHPAKYVPDARGALRDVRFHGNVRLEALPFRAAAFEVIVSQFGFEYAAEEPAVAEVARCLAPGGRLRFVLHAREGVVAQDTALRLQRLRSVLADEGALTLVLALARAASTGDSATIAVKSAKLPAAAENVRRLGAHPPPDDAALFYTSEFLRLWARRERYHPSDLLRSIEDGWANARGVATRQEEMLKAARSASDISRLCARFAGLGLEVADPRQLRDARGAWIAWLLDANKKGGEP
ncbi:MAG TPA: methyltransferase domain-containing protein [Woeseiaceae bacterium]|nr:methyltransferase domain-containing protein [Woeseiaceae bacterium]